MSALTSISGLATGIDFRGLVDQIIEVESERLDSLRLGITRAEATRDGWGDARTLLESLRTASGALTTGSGIDSFLTSVGGGLGLLEVAADASARPGTHSVRILERAQRESLGSELQASRTAALGITGQFVVGTAAVSVSESDSLESIAAAVNATNTGANASGVGASVVGASGAFRLVLSASETGAAGAAVRDVSGVLADLGFFDGTVSLSNRTSGGFASAAFGDASTAVGALLGFEAAPAGVVTLGQGANAFSVALDLSSSSLEGVRDQINAAAIAAGSSMRADLEPTSDGDGQRLLIEGTAAAEDDGGVLQALGLLGGGRASVLQRLEGGVLSIDGSGAPAGGSTLLTSLFDGDASAGVSAGDTIVFEGVRHDGSSFLFTHTIDAGDTLGTLAARLEGTEGFDGSAAVVVNAEGRLEVTATTGGTSRLALSTFAANENGGRLDLGAFQVSDEGRARVLSEGRNALVEVDGFLVESASNEVTNVIQGVTLSLRGTDPGQELEVDIARDVEAGTEAIRAFVDAYNALAALVDRGIGTTGPDRPVLAGDSLLRDVRRQVKAALDTALPISESGSFRRLAEIGIEITRDGTYTFDTAAVQDALRTDAVGVLSLLGGTSVASSSAVQIVGSSARTTPGTYAVEVTQVASRAAVRSTGFAGVYTDDATPDRLVLDDAVSGGRYEVALSDGMSVGEITDALRTELGRATRRELVSDRTWYSDAAGTSAATAATTLAELHHGPGAPAGFEAGTVVTFSGTSAAGEPVLGTFEVVDPATQTVGDLLTRARAVLGGGATVVLEAGRWAVRSSSTGASPLTLNVGSDVAGNPAPLGTLAVTEEGRSASSLTAVEVDGELEIRRGGFGSDLAFTLSFEAGGADGTSSLGIAVGTYDGTDVAGSIGGEEATGRGNLLTAADGTTAEGLELRVTGGEPGSFGTVTFVPGVGSAMEAVLARLLGTGDGSIDAVQSRLDESRERLERRLDRSELRLEDRRARLLAQFAVLERVIAQAQAQGERLAAQLASLPGRRES